MLRTSYTSRQQESTVVKVDPTMQMLRTSRLVMFIVGALWLVWLVVSFGAWLLFKQNSLPGEVGYAIFMTVYFVYMLLFQTWVTRFWKRLEQRRQAAARGDPQLLAADQPYPDAYALSLPATIRQRINRNMWLIFGIALLLTTVIVVVVILILSVQLPPHQSLSSTAILVIAAIVLFLFAVLFGIIGAVLYARVRQQLTVTETGLIMSVFGQVHSVSWREARLLAIDAVPGAKRYPHPALLELSSANDIVRWNWLRNSLRTFSFAQPVLPQTEYDRQMRALLSLIAARTGLPLYDLRDKP